MCRRQTPGREREREGRERERERVGDRYRKRKREREGQGERGREKEGGGVREAFVGVIMPTMHTCMRTHKYCTLAKDSWENE